MVRMWWWTSSPKHSRRRGRSLPQGDRVRQVPRDALDVGRRVAVADVRLAQRQPVADPVEPAGDRAGEGEVGVRVGTRDPALHPGSPTVADLAEAERAVVHAPADPGRRPRSGLEALVAVHGRRPQQAELARRGDLSGEVLAEQVAHVVRPVAVEQRPPAVERPQAGVHVTARTGVVERVLRHERHGSPETVGDLLRRGLVHEVAVGHLHGLGVVEVDLVLAAPRLALGELHGHPGGLQPAADRADDVLVLGGLQHVVVLEPRRVRTQVAVALGVSFVVGVVEQVELDLTGHHRQMAERRGCLHLPAQHGARRHLDQLAGGDVVEIAEHERGALDPRRHPHGGPVGSGEHVPVTLLVAGEAVAGHRFVVQVAGDEVVAVLRAVVGDVVEEEPAAGALADHPPLQVGEGHDDGVDLAAADHLLQRLAGDRRATGHGGTIGALQRAAADGDVAATSIRSAIDRWLRCARVAANPLDRCVRPPTVGRRHRARRRRCGGARAVVVRPRLRLAGGVRLVLLRRRPRPRVSGRSRRVQWCVVCVDRLPHRSCRRHQRRHRARCRPRRRSRCGWSASSSA